MAISTLLTLHARTRPATTIRHIRQWIQLRLNSTTHEVRVMHIAVALYDLLEYAHDLPPRYRRILKIGALLHDIGRTEGPRKHHLRGQHIIEKARTLPLEPTERCFAAYAARHHRGTIPNIRQDLQIIPREERRNLRILLAIIRAADALDKRNYAQPLIHLRLRGRELRFDLKIHRNWRKTRKAYDRRRKFRMLGDELDIPVRLRLIRA